MDADNDLLEIRQALKAAGKHCSVNRVVKALEGSPPKIALSVMKILRLTVARIGKLQNASVEVQVATKLEEIVYSFTDRGKGVYAMYRELMEVLWEMYDKAFLVCGTILKALLLESCNRGDPEILRIMLPYNEKKRTSEGPTQGLKFVQLNWMNSESNCAIHLACRQAHLECVKVLVEIGGDDVNRISSNSIGATGAHAAVFGGSLEVLKYLLEERHAIPNPTTTDGTTLMHLACVRGHAHLVKYLIENPRTRANPFFGHGVSGLEVSAFLCKCEAIEAVFDSIVSISPHKNDSKMERGAIVKAAYQTYEKQRNEHLGFESYMFKVFLSIASTGNRENKEKTDEDLARGLQILIKNCSKVSLEEILSSTISPGDDVSPIKSKLTIGDTLLHVCARSGRYQCIDTLLKAGANISLRNSTGETAVDCAIPFLADPTCTFESKAVSRLINHWESLRVSAEKSMNDLILEDKVIRPKDSKEKRKQKKKRKGKSNRKSSSLGGTSAINDLSTKIDNTPHENEGHPNDASDDESEGEGPSAENSNIVDGSDQVADVGGAMPEDDGEWLKPEGGRVRFSSTKEQVSLENKEITGAQGDVKKFEMLLQDSIKAAKTLKASPSPPPNPVQKEVDSQATETFDTTSTIEYEGIGTCLASENLEPPPPPLQDEREENTSIEPVREENVGHTLGDQSEGSSQNMFFTGFPHELGLNVPATNSLSFVGNSENDTLASSFEQIMRQFHTSDMWESAWPQEPILESFSTLMPSGSSIPVDNFSVPSHASLQAPEPMQRQPDLVSSLFEEMEPQAHALGLKVENLFGMGLHELSVSQLDFLRELHLKQLNLVMEASLSNAIEHGRNIAEEERFRNGGRGRQTRNDYR